MCLGPCPAYATFRIWALNNGAILAGPIMATINSDADTVYKMASVRILFIVNFLL